MRLKFYYKKPLFDVNLKEYGELENVLPSFFIAIFACLKMFRNEFGQIYINIPVLNWFDEERPNSV